MSAQDLDHLAALEISAPCADVFGLSTRTLHLRRAWPRSAEHILLEYVTERGRVLPGQWFADRRVLDRAAMQTKSAAPAAACLVAETPAADVLLQTGGADRRLTVLPALVARAGATLLVHRPERRAVVRLEDDAPPRYAKVVRPERAAALARASGLVAGLAASTFDVPRVLDADVERGVVLFAALAGRSLRARLDAGTALDACRAAGRGVRGLHEIAPMGETARHDEAAEVAVLERWVRHVEAWRPALATRVRNALPAVAAALRAVGDGDAGPGLLHRDLHDQQILIDDAGHVGLLDFDLLAVGDPALDVANLIGHFELRVLQGRGTMDDAARRASAFLDGYAAAPPVRERLEAFLDATRLRLACVYAFRPPHASVVPALLDRLGQPVPGVLAVPAATTASRRGLPAGSRTPRG